MQHSNLKLLKCQTAVIRLAELYAATRPRRSRCAISVNSARYDIAFGVVVLSPRAKWRMLVAMWNAKSI